MVIFLAGLRQIPQIVLRGGRHRRRRPVAPFAHITLPLLTPIIFFNLVLQLIGAFQASRRPSWSAAAPAARPTRRCSTRSTCTSEGFGTFDMGYASAMAWVLLVDHRRLTAVNFLLAKVLGVLR